MRTSLLARSLAYLGAFASVLLLLRATGLLDLLGNGLGGSGAREGVFHGAVPGVGAKWRELHARYAADIAADDKRPADSRLQAVWYGDSLIESWRGSVHGETCAACSGVPDVWGRHFGGRFRSQAYGIAGDQSGNMLWRLRHGERHRRRQPHVSLLHVGAADIDAVLAAGGEAAAVAAVPGIVDRIEASLKLLHRRQPEGRVVLLALLPQASPADGTSKSAAGDRLAWPSAVAPAIHAVNARLEELADRYMAALYVDCGPTFLVSGLRLGERRINPELMPDGRQPNADGMHRLGLCLDSLMNYLVKERPKIQPDAADEPDDPTPDDPKNLQTSIGSAVPAVSTPGDIAAAQA